MSRRSENTKKKGARIPPTPKKSSKNRFDLRVLGLMIVVDERDAEGKAVNFNIELGPFPVETADDMHEFLDKRLPEILKHINENGLDAPR